MKFIQVDPDSVEAQSAIASRSGVIAPIIKGFLDTGFFMVEINPAEIGRKAASVSASIAAYAIHHIVPVRPVLRSPKLYLQRRDIDKDGNPIENWKDELLEKNANPDTLLPSAQLTFETVPLPKAKK